MGDDSNSNPNVGIVNDADIEQVTITPKLSRNNCNVTISCRQKKLHSSNKKKGESVDSNRVGGYKLQVLDISDE